MAKMAAASSADNRDAARVSSMALVVSGLGEDEIESAQGGAGVSSAALTRRNDGRDWPEQDIVHVLRQAACRGQANGRLCRRLCRDRVQLQPRTDRFGIDRNTCATGPDGPGRTHVRIMQEAPTQSADRATGEHHSPPEATLPTIVTRLTRRDILAVATRLSKAGKLPGFAPETHGGLFIADAHAWPLDRVLVVRATEDRAGDATLTFELKPRLRVALFLLLVCLVAVWPGVWITHSMLGVYFDWYSWPLWVTCLWYIPMTAGPLPWVALSLLRKSKKEAYESARSIIEVLRETIAPPAASNPPATPNHPAQRQSA